jgi:glycosyltransferase involved in cell wall biosynthesis
VVPPGDAEALAEGVRCAGADPRAARERADLSQEMATECFAASRCVAAHAALYAELVAAVPAER